MKTETNPVLVLSRCRKKNHMGYYNVWLEKGEKKPKCPKCIPNAKRKR